MPESESDEPIRITVEQAMSGRWVTPPVSYVDPTRRFCAFTGRPIARQYWQVVVGDRELSFADRDLALRYATYPISFKNTGPAHPSTASQ